MAFQLSPGVNVSEIDLTTIVPQVGTTTGGFVGIFNWGPVDEIRTMSNEIDVVNTFGLPDANTFESFFTAANFLSYADNLKLVRSVGAAARNAANTGILIKNRDAYEASYSALSSSANGYIFAAKYPGSLGNSLKVSVCANNAAFASYPYASNYNGAPNTSTYVAGVSGSGDEMHVTVVDEDGFISGTANTVLERFGYVSKASDATNEDGSSNYYVNVITNQSKYVYAIAHAANSNAGVTGSSTAFSGGDGGTAGVFNVSLTGGVDASPATANVQVSYDKFKNADEIDVSLIITGPHSNVVSKYIVDNIAEVRKDCVVFISPQKTDVVNQSGSEVTNITSTRNSFNSSSYAFFDSGWKYQFDKYNNVYRWVPLNGDIAGLCVRTDTQRDAWFSPAGFNRGQIKNVVKLAWNPTKTNRDDLYKIGVNSVVTFQGEGTVLYGDKTMLSKPSAFDRINVRRLFIVLEKAIARAAKYSLFEFNDEFTRAQFKALVEPYLRDVQGRRGIFDFKVVCDATNNTPEVIDRNEFVGDIYIKPARSINYIQLNFVAVRTGVAFEEIVGRF